MIYLDNAATTKPLDSLKELLEEHLNRGWFNPSAMYPPALQTGREVEKARELLKDAAGAAGAVFNSCGTEGANTAILSGFRRMGGKKLHFITSAYEHPCVYEAFLSLKEQGHEVDFIRPNRNGVIEKEAVAALVRENTALVSVMHVNNETGAINDVAGIAVEVKKKNSRTAVHIDGVQGFLKCPFRLSESCADYYTVSAHKLHGLKGTGALLYSKDAPLRAYLMGGGQEEALRSGTENTFGILAFAHAVERYLEGHEEKIQRLYRLRARMLAETRDMDAVVLSPESGAPHILNVSFPGMRGEVLLHLLEREEIYISTGSACSSKKRGFSRIHQALGLTKEVAQGAVRISFCPDNTEEEIAAAAEAMRRALSKFRGFVRR